MYAAATQYICGERIHYFILFIYVCIWIWCIVIVATRLENGSRSQRQPWNLVRQTLASNTPLFGKELDINPFSFIVLCAVFPAHIHIVQCLYMCLNIWLLLFLLLSWNVPKYYRFFNNIFHIHMKWQEKREAHIAMWWEIVQAKRRRALNTKEYGEIKDFRRTAKNGGSSRSLAEQRKRGRAKNSRRQEGIYIL